MMEKAASPFFYSPNNSTANALFELLKGLIPVQDKMYNLYKYEYWVEFGKDVRLRRANCKTHSQ